LGSSVAAGFMRSRFDGQAFGTVRLVIDEACSV
jgi:hypothetical protein